LLPHCGIFGEGNPLLIFLPAIATAVAVKTKSKQIGLSPTVMGNEWLGTVCNDKMDVSFRKW
jgi:hypothetical protein